MTLLTWIYLLVVIALTSVGSLSALLPEFDIANYFRPWLVAASLPALIIYLSANHRPVHRTLGLLVFVANTALLLYPVFTNASGRVFDKTKNIKIITVNVLHINQDIDRVSDFLRAEKADIVLLQETHRSHLTAIRTRLREIYPFVHTCDCRNLVLLSRFPWQVSGGNRLTHNRPAMIWARFARPGRGSYRVVGVHAATPLTPALHVRQLQWLADRLPDGERLIVAGDFNATPWSTKLMQMSAKYRLQRTMTFAASWPSQSPFPLFMIDNVFVSNLFTVRDARVGPDVGSDHRPVVVEIAVPS